MSGPQPSGGICLITCREFLQLVEAAPEELLNNLDVTSLDEKIYVVTVGVEHFPFRMDVWNDHERLLDLSELLISAILEVPTLLVSIDDPQGAAMVGALLGSLQRGFGRPISICFHEMNSRHVEFLHQWAKVGPSLYDMALARMGTLN